MKESALAFFLSLVSYYLNAQTGDYKDSVQVSSSISDSTLSSYSIEEVSIFSSPNKTIEGISRHVLDMEKSQYMAGTLQDPSRMLLRFPGVTSPDDSRNNLVVRGNSPVGVGWYIEGLPSLNPNHFATAGNSGGGINILNPYALQNINFYTGAFPAQYGNALSAIVDVKLRPGNQKRKKYHFRTSLIDVEAGLEGPFNKRGKASYLAVYRRFNVDIAKKVYPQLQGFVGNAPDAQDLSFKLHFPNRKGYTSLYGILGKSHLKLSEAYESKNQIIARSASLLGGGTYSQILSEQTRLNVHMAYSVMHTANGQVQDLPPPTNLYETKTKHTEYKVSTHLNLLHTLNTSSFLRAGLLNSFSTAKQVYSYSENGILSNQPPIHIDYNLFQAYTQWDWNPFTRLEVTSGLHALYFSLNHQFHIEPRFAISWKISTHSSLGMSYGKQSQFPPSTLYVLRSSQPNSIAYHKHLHANKSNQLILSFQSTPLPRFTLKLEAYYLRHFQIIDHPYPNHWAHFSGLNIGYDFGDDLRHIGSNVLANTGLGRSYGVELFMEKYLGTSTYLMATASIYEAKYKGNWDIERNTAFNGRYNYNLLLSKSWALNLKRTSKILTNLSIRGAGGRRYSPPHPQTRQFDPKQIFSKTYKDYFRSDFKISLSQNFNSFSHKIGLDLRNLFNTRNILYSIYNFRRDTYENYYQLGFLPLVMYEIHKK